MAKAKNPPNRVLRLIMFERKGKTYRYELLEHMLPARLSQANRREFEAGFEQRTIDRRRDAHQVGDYSEVWWKGYEVAKKMEPKS